ncbi:BA14K family protein [Rhizobium miluonense]|jgi:hypothetical protein|nr:BA14K family protein [Rhizobium miluonense]
MKMNRIHIYTLTTAIGLCSIVPVYAFPVAELPKIQQSDVIQVRDFGHPTDQIWRGHGHYHYNNGYSHSNRDYGRYHNYHRDGNGNAGAIIGGIAAAAIIGGAIASQSHYNPGSHAQYCANRYRSYRASDNSFQPNIGPRVECR